MVSAQSSKSKKWIVSLIIIFSIFIASAIIIKMKHQETDDSFFAKEMNEEFDMAAKIIENDINQKNYYGTMSDLVYRTIPDGSFHLQAGWKVDISSKENEYDNVYILDEYGRGKNLGKLNAKDTISFQPETGGAYTYAIYSGSTNITDKLTLTMGPIQIK